jgi:nitroreductase
MINTLFKRKSVRSYTGENITDEELKIILKAADASPIGMRQYENLHLTIITNKGLFDKINEAVGIMPHRPNAKPLYDAPTMILISSKKYPDNKVNVMYSNAAIISHNISLAATELNIGSCYIWGAISAILNSEEILQELNLPEGFIPCCSVVLGKTNEVFEEREIPERISKSYIK